MRDDYPREKTSALTWLLAAIAGAFVLELVLFSPWFDASSQLVNGLAVTTHGLASGRVWTLATYWLIHSPTNLFNVGLVLAGLYALGRELEPLLGARRFAGVFAASLVLLQLSASNALFFLLPFAVGYGGTFVLLQRVDP